MEFRPIGTSGVQASKLALGAMSLGSLGTQDREECTRIVQRAVEAGINVIDTADIYSDGESEVIVGRALGRRRDQVLVASKCFWPMSDRDPNARGGSRRWILRACEDTLARLGTDYLDIYYLHKPDPATDLDESLGAMSDLVHQGKVRMVGLSTFPADYIVEVAGTAARRAHVMPKVEQPPYSILNRHIERNFLPACDRHGLGVMVWGPLNSGYLTGKYTRGAAPPAASRFSRWPTPRGAFDTSRPEVVRKLEIVDALSGLSAEAGVPLTHLALGIRRGAPGCDIGDHRSSHSSTARTAAPRRGSPARRRPPRSDRRARGSRNGHRSGRGRRLDPAVARTGDRSPSSPEMTRLVARGPGRDQFVEEAIRRGGGLPRASATGARWLNLPGRNQRAFASSHAERAQAADELLSDQSRHAWTAAMLILTVRSAASLWSISPLSTATEAW